MKIYADPITVNCRKVLAGLKFLGADYTLVHTDYLKGEFKSPEYMKINPNACLPTMVDEGLTLWESNAILQYAADKYNRTEAYPRDLKTRADINRWLLWESSSWFPSAYVYLVENCVKPVLGAEPDPKVLAGEEPRFRKLAGILESRLADSDWLCGDNPTIADIVVAAPMHLHAVQGLPLKDFPNLAGWMTEKVEKLPAWDETYVGPGFTLKRAA
jgi:glutathione S-transferase